MLASQWVEDSGKQYYFTASGAMAKDCYVRSDKPIGPGQYIYYWINDRGEWEPQHDTEKPYLVGVEVAV